MGQTNKLRTGHICRRKIHRGILRELGCTLQHPCDDWGYKDTVLWETAHQKAPGSLGLPGGGQRQADGRDRPLGWCKGISSVPARATTLQTHGNVLLHLQALSQSRSSSFFLNGLLKQRQSYIIFIQKYPGVSLRLQKPFDPLGRRRRKPCPSFRSSKCIRCTHKTHY